MDTSRQKNTTIPYSSAGNHRNVATMEKPAPVARAESAPPTRGREGFEKPMPLPKAPMASNGKPPTNPATSRKNVTSQNGSASSSCALRRPKRMLPRDPMASRCSVAMSRTESIIVSASGDVMVCRCRRSSTPYIPVGSGYCTNIALMDPWTNLLPCCDADFITEGPWSPVFDSLTVQMQTSTESTASEGSTYEWEKVDKPKLKHVLSKPSKANRGKNSRRNGLLHNSSRDDASVASRLEASRLSQSAEPRDIAPTEESSPRYQAPTMKNLMDFNAYDGGIIPLPSFDYDHIHNGQNDMLMEEMQKGNSQSNSSPAKKFQTPTNAETSRKNLNPFPTIMESPEEKKDEPHTPTVEGPDAQQSFYHGIPIFLSSLSQIRVRKVSSHPLGAHVLMISDEALLFSYGLNNHGQLGVGVRSSLKDAHRGFRTSPTLITPLLENGGKAINCAAGVDHSLVVVVTEGRRLQRLQTNPGVAYSDHGAPLQSDGLGKSASDDQDSVQHQQLYGFGSNDFMKIGLVRARLADDGSEGDGEDILLPRRVALHCTVWPEQDQDVDDGPAYMPPQGIFDIAASAEHSAALVRRATGDIEVYMWGNATLGALGLPVTQDPDLIIKGGLTQRPTSNANNIFPLPTVLESLTFRPHRDSPLGFPREVSLGPHCTFVVMSSGKCMSFGFSAEGMLGHELGTRHSMEAKEVSFTSDVNGENGIIAVNAGAYHVLALTGKGEAYSWGINSDDRLGHGTTDFVKIASNPGGDSTSKENLVVIEWLPQKIDLSLSQDGRRTGDSMHCIEICAGYDSSMLVAKSGEVYSFGKRSGRLGKGEVGQDVSVPEPLHGGLRLFHRKGKDQKAATGSGSTPSSKPLLKRFLSDGAFKVM